MTIIEEYIQSCHEKQQPHLIQMYHLCKEVLPNAKEKISWGMPTFYGPKNIIHFYGHKNHMGVYPGSECVKAFETELKNHYKYSKGAIQFPYEKPLPVELLKRICAYCLENNR